MYQRTIYALRLFIAFVLICPLAVSAELRPRSLQYNIGNNILDVGLLNLRLNSSDSGRWQLLASTNPAGLATLIGADDVKALEQSDMQLNASGQLETLNYQRVTPNNTRHWTRTLGSGRNSAGGSAADGPWLDRLGLQVELARQLGAGARSGSIAYFEDDGQPATYRWAVQGASTVEVSGHPIQALRVLRQDGARSVISWHSASLDYLPVKMEFNEQGSLEVRMVLVSHQAL